jgi:putative ABC transport system permease protein
MLQNYLKIAWRNLLKHKSFSLINILGLSIGIAACLIIFLYVHDEMNFDLYNVKKDRIVRVTTTLHTPESDVALSTSPAPLADALKRYYPEVEAAVRFQNPDQAVKWKQDIFKETNFFKTDQSVFSVFDFEFLEGVPAAALVHPASIVITETTAKKYFGNASALGKIMVCNDENYTVTAVIKDRPANSDLPIDAMLSADYSNMTHWMDDLPVHTYVLFYKNPDLTKFKAKLVELSRRFAQPELDAGGGADKYKAIFEPEPLSAVHFSLGKLDDTPKGNKQFIFIFSLLAVFILLIALLNYINLSTAKATERAKEVGIRKVSGASQFQLVRQFLFEAFFLLLIACLLAVGLAQLGLPLFNKILQTKLSIQWATAFGFVGIIFLVTLLLAGLYPAFVLSAFQPAKVLKGSWRRSSGGVLLRKILTITQFAMAAALITGTTVIYHQMKFIRETNLGFNKDQLLNIWFPTDSAHMGSVKAFQHELRQRPEISGLTVGNGMTAGGGTLGSTKLETNGKKREMMCIYYSIDPDFLPVFQIPLLEGRNLSDSFTTDRKEAFLVNEAFVKSMGWKSGIGKIIDGMDHKGPVVGVVKNFYFNSLHNKIDPLIMVYNQTPANTTTVRIKPKDLPILKELFKKNLPTVPMDYSFFDEILNKQYEKDRMTMSLFNDFTVLAIFVSCLGLYGLVALIAVQRTKEIGIRKVLGATLRQLFSLLSKDFFKLVIWALVIALPVAGIAMSKWLSSYAYHVELSWWMFLIPVLLLLLIALLVISREIIRTSLANPVNSLRSE